MGKVIEYFLMAALVDLAMVSTLELWVQQVIAPEATLPLEFHRRDLVAHLLTSLSMCTLNSFQFF